MSGSECRPANSPAFPEHMEHNLVLLVFLEKNVSYASPLTADRVEVDFKMHARADGRRVAKFEHTRGVFHHLSCAASYSSYLGDFKDELAPGESILEFCSGGPKIL